MMPAGPLLMPSISRNGTNRSNYGNSHRTEKQKAKGISPLLPID
jgi:hypothetical protein